MSAPYPYNGELFSVEAGEEVYWRGNSRVEAQAWIDNRQAIEYQLSLQHPAATVTDYRVVERDS